MCHVRVELGETGGEMKRPSGGKFRVCLLCDCSDKLLAFFQSECMCVRWKTCSDFSLDCVQVLTCMLHCIVLPYVSQSACPGDCAQVCDRCESL